MQNVCKSILIPSLKLITSARITKKGYPIVVELFDVNHKRTKKTIGHSTTKDWNFDLNEPFATHPNFNELIPLIKDYNAKITEIIYRKYGYDLAYNILFNNTAQNTASKGILNFLDQFIAEKEASGIQADHFLGLRGVLQNYIPNDMPIAHIDYEWLQQFRLHKLQNGQCSESGVQVYFKNLKTVYREAQRRKSLNVPAGNPFEGLLKTTKRKEVIEFSSDDFKKLLKYQPNKNLPDKSRFKVLQKINLVLLQFYIGGHDFSDVAMLEWTNIKEGRRLVFKRFKNRNKVDGGETINNYICNEAVNIIQTYGNPNTKRIFSHIPSPKENYTAYKYARTNLNRLLKSVSEQIGSQRLSSKSMRYIFRTYAGELLIHDFIVTKLQGHRPNHISYGYQGKISFEVQDREHQKIIDVIRQVC